MFFLNVGVMLLVASALTAVLFGKRNKSVYVVVLSGLVLGAVLRSLSPLIARVLDPSSFMVLQDNLFASFTPVNPQLIWLCAVPLCANCNSSTQGCCLDKRNREPVPLTLAERVAS